MAWAVLLQPTAWNIWRPSPSVRRCGSLASPKLRISKTCFSQPHKRLAKNLLLLGTRRCRPQSRIPRITSLIGNPPRPGAWQIAPFPLLASTLHCVDHHYYKCPTLLYPVKVACWIFIYLLYFRGWDFLLKMALRSTHVYNPHMLDSMCRSVV